MKSLIRLAYLFVLVLIFSQTATAQKKVQKFTVSHIVNAPAEKVWAVVGDDYGKIAQSHPRIIKSDYVGGSLRGEEGAERVCYFNESGTRFLKEKMVNFDPANMTFKNTVFQAGKFPVDPAYTYAIYKVEPIDANTSRFSFDMTYRTKPAFMGGMMKGNFKKLIEDYAIAIEHHVNTGEKVTKDNFKTVKRQYAR